MSGRMLTSGKYCNQHGVKRTWQPYPSMPGAALVPLTRGLSAIVDVDVVDEVTQFNWHIDPGQKTHYARRGFNQDGRKITESMHRFLWKLWGNGSPETIDHINGNGLDKRRVNLRAATRSQNQWNMQRQANNTSGFKGVSFKAGRWVAQIGRNPRYHLGCFDNAEAAHQAYIRAATKLYGEYARGE